MDFISKNRSILIGLGAIVLLAVVYLLFFDKSSSTPDLTTTSTASSPSELFFANLENELNPIQFDTSIFNDPRFAALVDIRTAITPETEGRPDPFAPISGVSQ